MQWQIVFLQSGSLTLAMGNCVVLMVPSMSATTSRPCSNAWVTHPATNRALRCLTSQLRPDTLRVAVKASSYSKAVCVSYIPVVPTTTTPLPPFFFRSQSCPCMSSSNTSDTIVVLMVPSMSATTSRPCSNAWVTHPATNRALRCLTSQLRPDTLRVAVKASSYSEAVCVSYIPVVPTTTTIAYGFQ